jgi:hypothetical protein
MMPATTQGTVKLVADLVKMVEKWLLSMPEEYVGRFIPFFIIAAALSITAEAVAGTCRSLSRSHLPVHTVNAHGTQKKTHIALCLAAKEHVRNDDNDHAQDEHSISTKMENIVTAVIYTPS